MMARASRARAKHYGGSLRILHKGTLTIINRGAAACGTSHWEHLENMSLNVTCKRCLRLLALDAKTVVDEMRAGRSEGPDNGS